MILVKVFLPECAIATLSRREKHRQKCSFSGLVSKLTFTVTIIHLMEKTVKVCLGYPWAILKNFGQIRGKKHTSSHFFLNFLVFSPVFKNRGKTGERTSPLPDVLFLSDGFLFDVLSLPDELHSPDDLLLSDDLFLSDGYFFLWVAPHLVFITTLSR